MPLPVPLRSLVQDRRFWTDYFWEEDSELDAIVAGRYRDLRDCRVDFPVSDHYGLVLDMDEELSYFSLSLRSPEASDPVEIAWDDQAHWHPHVLRWEELDLVGRCVALGDPELPHPGLPVVLLHRFTPTCVNDDVDVIDPMLASAYRSLRLFTDREIDAYLERRDYRQGRFTWEHREPLGWTLSQDEAARGHSGYCLYSLRTAENDEFPFRPLRQIVEEAKRTCARAVQPSWLQWNRGAVADLARQVFESGDLGGIPVLADALEESGCQHPAILAACRPPVEPARACWVVEVLLGEEPGRLVKRHFGPARRGMRTLYRLDIDVPVRTRTFTLPPESYLRIAESLDRALAEAGLGGASMSGTSTTYDQRQQPVEETERLSVAIRGDLEHGVRIIREVLVRNQAPEGTSIRLTAPEQRTIPLRPDHRP
jgi:hypothetical protein